MGGWASILFFCSGRAGGRRDFVVENRVGVGGRPDTPGPVGGPGASKYRASVPCSVRPKFILRKLIHKDCRHKSISRYVKS